MPLRKASKRGIDVRLALPLGVKKDLVENFSQVGKVKQFKGDGARFAIIDAEHLLLFLTDDMNVHKSYDCAVWIEAPHFVKYFHELFESEWKRN